MEAFPVYVPEDPTYYPPCPCTQNKGVKEFVNNAWRLTSENLYSVWLQNETSAIVKDEPRSNELLSMYTWIVGSRGYMITRGTTNGRSWTKMFHRMLLNPLNKNYDVDHINGCQLDNRPENLRIVSKSVNIINSTKRQHKFGIAGVSYNKRTSCYTATWRVDKKTMIKSFSVARYGHELALKLAIQYRKDMISTLQPYIDNKKMPDGFNPLKYRLSEEYFHSCLVEPVRFETKK